MTGAAEHNLKDIDVEIPRYALTVVTGLSGSGKSSLAFDTIYAEGQRRYVESLSSYARQFLDQMQKPHVEHIEGLSPAISIEQKSVSKNPRSTVGTVTEIYDYLRILYASIGQPHCPECGQKLQGQTVQQMVDQLLAWDEGERLMVMAPMVRGRKGEYGALFDQALREGFTRALVDGEMIELEAPPKLDKRRNHDVSIVIDRLAIRDGVRQRLADSLEIALKKAEGLAEVRRVERRKSPGDEPSIGESVIFSESMACPEHGPQITELVPRIFSFNSPYGACPHCKGIGTVMEIDEDLVVPDQTLSLSEGAVEPWASIFVTASGEPRKKPSMAWNAQLIRQICEEEGIDLDKPFGKLKKAQRDLLLYGAGDKRYMIQYTKRSGRKLQWDSKWEGEIPRMMRRWKETGSEGAREHYHQFFSDRPCPECGGARLKPESRAVTIHDLNISEFCQFSIDRALEFMANADFSKRETEIGQQAIKEIIDRLTFLRNVGLGYLTLDRTARTLAGGEAQRIRLATQIGSQLVGVLYILDEPSIGLHHRDNRRLLDTLQRLRDMGNTVIVVEHDEDTIRLADWVIDLGPGAGRLGGEVVASGTPKQIQANKHSVTGQYLSGKRTIAVPPERRPRDAERLLTVEGAAEHNLKEIDVSFPLGLFTCVTGVSGSGKSTLVNDILFSRLANMLHKASHHPGKHRAIRGIDQIDKIINVDQSPIGRTPRSNPGHLHESLLRGARSFCASARVEHPRLQAGPVLVQREGRALRELPGRRHDQDRDALSARRVRGVRGLQRAAVQSRDAGDSVSR